MEKETLSIEETRRLLGISRGAAYQAAQRGELPVIRIGKRYLVLKGKLQQLLNVPCKVGKDAEVRTIHTALDKANA